jgi:hypothetical protein
MRSPCCVETILLVDRHILDLRSASMYKLTSAFGYLVLSVLHQYCADLGSCGMHRDYGRPLQEWWRVFAVRMRARSVSLVSVHPLPVILFRLQPVSFTMVSVCPDHFDKFWV